MSHTCDVCSAPATRATIHNRENTGPVTAYWCADHDPDAPQRTTLTLTLVLDAGQDPAVYRQILDDTVARLARVHLDYGHATISQGRLGPTAARRS